MRTASATSAPLTRGIFTLPLMIAASCASVAGCSSSTPPEPEPEAPATELSAISANSVSTPQDELFENAKNYFSNSLYSLAEESFTALRDSYPQGPFVQFAEIKLADIAFISRDYDIAAQRYQEFVSAHPSSPTTPYALYRAARSLQLSTRGVGRDISPVQKSIDLYKEMIERFPTSPYSSIAEKARLEAQQLVVAHEDYVRGFYEAQEQYAAAENRRKSYQEERKEYVAQARSLRSKEQSRALASGENSGALPKPNVVLALRSKDKKVDATSGDSLRAMLTDFEMDERIQEAALSLPEGTVQIERITCSKMNRRNLIVLTLSENLRDPEFVKQNLYLRGANGVLSLKVPQAVSEPRTMDCLATGDLLVSSHGLVTVAGVSRAELLEVNYPPRLLITTQ